MNEPTKSYTLDLKDMKKFLQIHLNNLFSVEYLFIYLMMLWLKKNRLV